MFVYFARHRFEDLSRSRTCDMRESYIVIHQMFARNFRRARARVHVRARICHRA